MVAIDYPSILICFCLNFEGEKMMTEFSFLGELSG